VVIRLLFLAGAPRPLLWAQFFSALNNEKKQQILALGQLGWSLRRIPKATRVRRETISTHLKAAGVGAWPPGGRGRQTGSKPAIEVTTDFGLELSAPAT
jgi:hypothetical protein